MHRHCWHLVAKNVLPSAVEQLEGKGQLTRIKADLTMGWDPFEKPAICHWKCVKCGKEKVSRV